MVAISPAIAVAQTQPAPMDIGAVGKGKSGKGGKGRKALANVTNKPSKHVQGAETRITLLQLAFTLARRAENVGRLVIWQVCVDLLEPLSPRPREVARRARGH